MRVLFITPYITSEKYPVFQRNRTGFGLMVYDIAKSVGNLEYVDMLSVNSLSPSVELDNFRMIKQSLWTIIKGFNIKSLVDSLRFINKNRLPMIGCIRVIYQHLAVGSLCSKISDYDIVHIHGCGPITNAATKLCKHHMVPFCITLHGLVSFENAVKLHPSLKQYEKDFLIEAYCNEYNVSFISTGIYEQAVQFVKSILK